MLDYGVPSGEDLNELRKRMDELHEEFEDRRVRPEFAQEIDIFVLSVGRLSQYALERTFSI